MKHAGFSLCLAVIGLLGTEHLARAQCACTTPSLTCHPPQPPAEPNDHWPPPQFVVRGSGLPTMPIYSPPQPPSPPRPLVAADPPRPRPGTWWYGATVPYAYQRKLYYPTWDEPLAAHFGCPILAEPADDVYPGGTPAYWRYLGK
jgi:hypothetical protein